MDVGLRGKVVIVTGATQGVGAEIARQVAASGADGVVAVGRDAQRGRAVATEVKASGASCRFVEADLADVDAPCRIAEAAVEAFGRIDGLVNAAGITDRGSFTTADANLWQKLFEVNARAPFFLMQAAIRDMLQRRAPGAIVNILSMNAHCGLPELAVYAATKAALATLTKNAAHAHLRDGIRVNGVMMGWAATPAEHVMQGAILGRGDNWAQEAAATLPLGRMLTVEEVARQAVWLLSDASGLQTGTLVDLEQRVVGAP